jgi:hypothetical protein
MSIKHEPTIVRTTRVMGAEIITTRSTNPHAYHSFQVYSVIDGVSNLPHPGSGAIASHYHRQRGDQNFEQTKLTTTKLTTSSEQTTR